MTTRQALVFYLGAPALCGQILGWNRVGLGRYLPLWESVAYWTGFVMLVWLCAVVGSRVAYRVLSRWEPRQLTVLGLGVLVGAALAEMPTRWLVAWGRSLAALDADVSPPVALGLTWAFTAELVKDVLPGALVWIAVNLAYDRLLGVPRYRYGTVSVVSQPVDVRGPVHDAVEAERAFLQRVPEHLRAPILAVSAEDHYIRVHTELGASLLYCRFGDALTQLEQLPGLQIHRSHWVRRSAVRRMYVQGHARYVVLSNGLRLPVSRSFIKGVRNVLGQSSDAAD